MTERDRKFEYDDKAYFKYIEQLDQLHEGAKDIVFNFPLYVGTVNLARYLGMYEMYKQVVDVAGHVADVGTYRGASFVFFAKMIKLLEPYSSTHVHGFDWFKGMAPQGDDNQAYSGQYKGDYERLLKHIELQDLSGFAHVHKMNIVEELGGFAGEESEPALQARVSRLRHQGRAHCIDAAFLAAHGEGRHSRARSLQFAVFAVRKRDRR